MNSLINHSIQNISFLFFLFVFTFYTGAQTHAGELTLAVANSACKTVKKVGKLYTQQHDLKINYICKSSGRLAKGLRGGAITADLYISANRTWMDYMLKYNLVLKQNISSPWGNKLVIAANKNSPLEINDLSELATDKVKAILIGDPSTAPFGRYAKEALQKTNLWGKVKTKIITKKHITLLADTLAVADGTTVGILFLSNTTNKHKILYSIEKSKHSPIRYYFSQLNSATNIKQSA
ncbi:MAG: molybdate ABC transporter substrate-binding protein, partial [Pseudomonadota bacterium]